MQLSHARSPDLCPNRRIDPEFLQVIVSVFVGKDQVRGAAMRCRADRPRRNADRFSPLTRLQVEGSIFPLPDGVISRWEHDLPDHEVKGNIRRDFGRTWPIGLRA